MKKILLLSDTHSYIDEKILKYVKQADEVWHAGDIGDLSVTDAIKKLTSLTSLNLCFIKNNMEDNGIKHIANTLESLKLLRTVDISINNNKFAMFIEKFN